MGTLDPMATGVLPVMLGGATRFFEFIPAHDKGYRAKILLGTVTDTLDITGTVLNKNAVNVTRSEIEETLDLYKGKIKQTPPMYSAISQGGTRLYELARKGIEVKREQREIEIFSLNLLSCNEEKGELEIDVHCSKGTYIRSLADDIGKSLGCGAVLTSLRRTLSNGFTLEDCITLEELEKFFESGRAEEKLISVEKAMRAYEAIEVTPAQGKRFSNGGELSLERLKTNKKSGLMRVFSENNFLGIGEIKNEESLCVKRVFNP